MRSQQITFQVMLQSSKAKKDPNRVRPASLAYWMASRCSSNLKVSMKCMIVTGSNIVSKMKRNGSRLELVLARPNPLKSKTIIKEKCMSPSMKKTLFTVMSVIFLISACAPAQPTANAVDIANQVATSVAMTVAAQNAQTQAAQSLVPEVTNTTLPTQTEVAPPSPTALPPTVTPILLPTTAPSSGGGGGTTTQADYACNAISRKPRDNTIFRPNASFDIKWTIVNT